MIEASLNRVQCTYGKLNSIKSQNSHRSDTSPVNVNGV